MIEHLDAKTALPADGTAGTLVGRAWVPGEPGGPAVIAIRDDGVYDLGAAVPTLSDLLNAGDPVALAQTPGQKVGDLEAILANSCEQGRDPNKPWLLAPADLQALKAAGVTFATSMLERVIEEQAKGDPGKAAAIRSKIAGVIGADLSKIQPGSGAAERLKAHLIEDGAWSQYLEVGIGPYAEIFTKGPPMSAVGTGASVGLHPESTWNNPEPEVVVAVSAGGRIVGAMLGNDVNLRDFEGRSALLLGKAKDNNGACALGPFLRLFDDTFGLDDVRRAELALRVEGPEGFVLDGHSSMQEISRDPLDLVRQMMGEVHQYPDGAMLMLGTLFAPTQDRDAPGRGFTHVLGDVVSIRCPELGTLVNRVGRSDRIPPWTFGARALMANLAARGRL